MVLCFLCLLNMNFIFLKKNSPRYRAAGPDISPIMLLYVIEFRDILCSPCLDSFLDFCLSLPVGFQEENTWGIVLFDPGLQSTIGEKILSKKVGGFKRANGLKFPIFIDALHIFESLRSQTSQLVFFNSSSLTVEKYAFPLKKEEKERILRAVLDSL